MTAEMQNSGSDAGVLSSRYYVLSTSICPHTYHHHRTRKWRDHNVLVCRICKEARVADSPLIDGSAFHRACFVSLQYELERLEAAERTLLIAIRKPLTFGENIWMFFSTSKQQELLREKQHLSWKLNLERQAIAKYRARLSDIYDVWPTYPPDWGERRDLVNNRDHHACSECGAGNNIHIHHRRALKDGGTNRLENLVSLCSHCHSQAHGGVTFKDRWTPSTTPSPLETKIACLQEAMAKKRDVFFHYKKPNGSVTKRTVTPRELRKLNIAELQSLLGRKATIAKEGRLCLFGYCHLRNEKRTFAVSRMYKLTLR